VFSVLSSGDSGSRSISKTFDLTAQGAQINSNFTVNTSQVIALDSLPDKTITKIFPNDAVARRWSFEILHAGQSTRAKIKRIKIKAVVYEEVV